MIERTEDPADRRAVMISLTGEGRGVVEAVTRARRDNVGALLRALPADRREQLVDLLDEFAELAENPRVCST